MSESGGEGFRGLLVQARLYMHVAGYSPAVVVQDAGAADYKLSAFTPTEVINYSEGGGVLKVAIFS